MMRERRSDAWAITGPAEWPTQSPGAEARPAATAGTRAAAILVVLGAFAVVVAGLESVAFDLDRYLVPKTLVLHGVALGLVALGFPGKRAPHWRAPEWLLAAFLAAGAVSAALAANLWLSIGAWGIGLSSFVILLACRELAPVYRWPMMGGLLAAAVLGAALGLAQAYGAGWSWLAENRAPGGTFGNRNFLAHLCALAAPALLVLVARSRPSRGLLPALLGLAVLAAAIVITRSRAAWLGGLGGVTTATLVLLAAGPAGRPGRARTLAALVAVVVAVSAAVLVPNQLRWTADSPYAHTLARLTEYGEGTGRGRLIQYRNSLELVREQPVLGVGPGNWFVHYPRVTRPDDPSFATHLSIPTNPWPSSDWVAFLTERGLLGTLLLVGAGLTALWQALVRARRGSRGDAQAAAALAGVLGAAVVAGSFDAVLLLAAPSYLVWAAVGLLLPTDGSAEPRGRRGAGVLKLGAAALLVLLVADAGARSAALVVTAEREDAVALARAARLSPGEYRLHLRLAEGGNCDSARRLGALMPHHENVRALLRGCAE